MRPEALRTAGRIGLTGVCAAFGVSVLAMSAAAQSPATPRAASSATHNKAFTQRLAEAYSEDSLAAPEEPAAAGVKPVAPPAAAPPAPPAPVATANAPAAAPKSGPETVRAEDLKAANQAADPGKTAYSRRKGTFGDKSAPQADTAAATAPAKAIPDHMVVVCKAGCEQQPGVMVLFKPVDPAVHLGPQATKLANSAAPASSGLTCVAGCFDTPQTYAGIPTGPQGLMAGGSEGRMVPASAQAPANKALSGDWMVRINRDRASDAKK